MTQNSKSGRAVGAVLTR